MLDARALRENLTRFRTFWLCFLLAATTLVTYWPVTHHEFTTYDDTDYVTQNDHVKAGLCAKTLAWVWSSDVARNWHPITMLSHALDWELFGDRPGAHHFVSLLFHIANSLLLFWLLQKMTGAFWRSAFVAGLFAVHPLHVESVAWIAERKDVLSTFFLMLILLAYERYAKGFRVQGSGVGEVQSSKFKVQSSPPTVSSQRLVVRDRSGVYWYGAALVLFALGLMCKPMLVSVPIVLLLLDFWPLQRVSGVKYQVSGDEGRGSRVEGQESKVQRLEPIVREVQFKVHSSKFKVQGSRAAPRPSIGPWSMVSGLLLEKVPFAIFSAASCCVTYKVQQRGGSVLDLQNLPAAARVSNALISYVRYLWKMIWPKDLTALYLRKGGWPDWEIGLAAFFLVAATVIVLWLARKYGYLFTGWFWYLITLVPVIGLVQVGMQSMADRYTYIPLIGVFVAIAWGAHELFSRTRRTGQTAAVATGAAIILLCCAVTRAQLVYWRDAESVFQRMIAVNPANYMAHYNLGNLCDRRKQPGLAIEHYQAAVAAEPNYAEAYCNLGGVLLRQGRRQDAIAAYETARRLRPDSMNYFNLANTLGDAGRLPEAVVAYREALRLNPKSSQAHHNLALILQRQGQNVAAIAEFRAAVEEQPDLEVAQYCLANLLAEAGNTQEAVGHYLAAERLNPGRAESYNGLGICYAMQGKFPEAEQQLRQAVTLTPENPAAQSNLGNALGAQNKMTEAIPHYEKALQINPKDFQTHYNLAISLIRQGKAAEAKVHLERALELHPDYPEAKSALATLQPTAK